MLMALQFFPESKATNNCFLKHAGFSILESLLELDHSMSCCQACLQDEHLSTQINLLSLAEQLLVILGTLEQQLASVLSQNQPSPSEEELEREARERQAVNEVRLFLPM